MEHPSDFSLYFRLINEKSDLRNLNWILRRFEKKRMFECVDFFPFSTFVEAIEMELTYETGDFFKFEMVR